MKTVKKILVLCFLLALSTIYSQEITIYKENFDKKGSWPTGSNDIRELNVFNGRYYFEHKRKEKSWKILTAKYNIDTSKDFELETSFQKISGIDNYGICFLYDYKDANNHKELSITSGGYFRVAETNGSKYSSMNYPEAEPSRYQAEKIFLDL